LTEEEKKKVESNEDTNESPDIKDLIIIIDKDFNRRYWRTLVKHHLLDLTFSILVFLILVLISVTLLAIQPVFVLVTVDASLPILLTSLALLISFVSLTLRWISTPMSSRAEYVRELSKKNCEQISYKHKIANNLVLYVLVRMKAIDYKTNLLSLVP
jgi:hypothetical protein